MPVIAEVSVDSDQFDLGQVFPLEPGAVLSLERLVPLETELIPFVRVTNAPDGFLERASEHPSVSAVEKIDDSDGEQLFAIKWAGDDGEFISAIRDVEGHILRGQGGADRWQFEVRFGSHEALNTVTERCESNGIPITLEALFNPTTPTAGPYYGVTDAQREALVIAHRSGYFGVPRKISSAELGEKLGISDQAAIERLRGGMASLLEHTLFVNQESD